MDAGRVGLRVQAWGRARADDPTYKEGSLRRLRVATAYSLNSSLGLSLVGEVSEAGPRAGGSVIGGLDGRY